MCMVLRIDREKELKFIPVYDDECETLAYCLETVKLNIDI